MCIHLFNPHKHTVNLKFSSEHDLSMTLSQHVCSLHGSIRAMIKMGVAAEMVTNVLIILPSMYHD